ncbi:hypothetical protein ACGGZK_04615 [Agromyces sp. MMS24-K17]|uniref:hypothetical protein n=1 Tax=Agromyces sp. MMS24-K17 TaxID=3372850 RepID=UPI003754EAC4
MQRRVRGIGAAAIAAAFVVAGIGIGAAPAQADPAETYLAVPSGRYPIDVDATPDDAYVFVISRGDGGESDLRVYDSTSFTELDVITFGDAAAFNPTAVQVSPDGTQVWVSFYNPGQILVYPAADLIAGGAPAPTVITGGGGFVDLTADPNGDYVYAATLFNPQYQFSTADPTAPPRTISLPNGSRGVTVSADGSTAFFTQYVAAPAGGVQAVDVAADGTLSTGVFTPTGDLPWGVTYVGAVDRVISSNSGTPTSLSAFTPPGGAVTTTPVDCGPRLADASPNGARGYLACLTGGIIAIDYTTATPSAARVPIGDNVESVAVSSDDAGVSHRLYATSGGSDELLVFTRPTVTGGGDQTVPEGTAATFTATADDFWQQIRWQSSADGGTTWVDVPGADGETLAVDGLLANSGTLYRLVATSAFFDPVASEPMLLTVTPAPTPVPCTPTAGSTSCPLAATGVDAGPAITGAAGGVLLGALLVVAGQARRRRIRSN